MSSDVLKARVEAEIPRALEDLRALVALPSISSLPASADAVRACAELTAELFRAEGVTTSVVTTGGARPAVIGTKPGPDGAPTVLLYAHHDVQPIGDLDSWTDDPFVLTSRGDRLYGRGSSDDKGGVVLHLAVLRAFGADLPVSISVLIEGEEEIGSPAFAALLAEHAGELRADVVLVPDAVNAAVGVPSLTTMLRGLVDLTVDLRTLERPVHSGLYGGVLPCALTTLVRLLATLHDDAGDVVVQAVAEREPSIPQSLADLSGLALAGVGQVGTGGIAERLVCRPSVTVLALDAVPVVNSSNVLHAQARAKLGVRLPPHADPEQALSALEVHLSKHVEHGAQLTFERGVAGRGFAAPATPLQALAAQVLGEEFGAACVELGVGGGIPFINALAQAFPDADFLVTALQDPQSRAHSHDESLHVDDFRKACLGQAQLLAMLGSPPV